MLNVSEGRDTRTISLIGSEARSCLLDVHSDAHHNRSVFTIAGSPLEVGRAALGLSAKAIELLDIATHEGAHPRMGVVDVAPFVPYVPWSRGWVAHKPAPLRSSAADVNSFADAVMARARFAAGLAELGVPCFYYGPERSLPDVRRRAFRDLEPDTGPSKPHPSAGSCCAGVRSVLVAYNVVVDLPFEKAKEAARSLRRPEVRALAFETGDEVQLSFNLVSPEVVGPETIFDEVARLAPVRRAELVGLLPAELLYRIAPERYGELGLSEETTIEAALAARLEP